MLGGDTATCGLWTLSTCTCCVAVVVSTSFPLFLTVVDESSRGHLFVLSFTMVRRIALGSVVSE